MSPPSHHPSSTISRFRDRLSTLSPLDKLVRATAAQAAPSPTLSYYHHHIPPTPATAAAPTPRSRTTPPPPVPSFPFGRNHATDRDSMGSPIGSPGSAASNPSSRRKGKPAPLVLTPPRQRVPGCANPAEGIDIVTTQASPTYSSSPSPSDALSFQTRARRQAQDTRPGLPARQASLPQSQPMTQPRPLFGRSQTHTTDASSEYATVEPGYVLPSWMHGTDNVAGKHSRMIDFIRIGGGGSAAVSASNYTGYDDDGDVFTDGGDIGGLGHKPSMQLSPEKGYSVRGGSPSGDALHNILLTPTYEAPILSPGGIRGEGRRRLINPLAKSPGGTAPGRTDRREKRATLLDRAAKLLAQKRMDFVDNRGVSYDDSKGKSVAKSAGTPTSATRRNAMEMGMLSRSDSGYENAYGYEAGKGSSDQGGEKRWKLSKNLGKRDRRRLKQVHVVMIVSAIVVGLLIISICTALLTKKSSSTTETSTSTTSSSSTATATSTAAATTPTTAAYTIDSCLSLFALSAPTSPTTYPCDNCVSLLQGATNDFTSSSSTGANATGVGATLQFCALQTIFAATGTTTAATTKTSSSQRRRSLRQRSDNSTGSLTGWMTNASPCTSWSGVTCDSQGRVTALALAYPAVPSTLASSITNLVGLSSLKIVGNSVIPAGTFPDEILSLSGLTSLDIESTALSGSIPADAFDTASKLQTLVLVSNAKLGTRLPSFYGASAIETITITGQSLTAIPSDLSTSTLSYLDLSYNSLTGSIPDTSGYPALTTLFLEGNSFSSLPSAFAPNLASLSLQGNTGLTGVLPSALCSSTSLKTCTLTNTLLGTSNEVNKTAISFASATTVVGSSTIAAYAAVTSVSTSGAVCGVCTF